MTGPIFEHELVFAELTEQDEAVVLVHDDAPIDVVTEALRAVKELGFKFMSEIYYDKEFERDVMVFSR